jgi:2-polyprenyl-3-methyl-5-hydroxy-6-metoxy-1,4-benzoquinol methylase
VSELAIRALGWRALLIHGDPCVLDRWLWLRRHLRSGHLRTFDAGCGNGAFSIYAARLGNRVVAASFARDEIERTGRRAEKIGIPNLDLRAIDLRELEKHKSELGYFDQIVCFETIEHVRDDDRLVNSLAGLLSPGGVLLLTTPFDRHRPMLGESLVPNGVEDGSHVRYGYSPQRLVELMTNAGLRVVDQDYVSGIVSQRVTNLMRRVARRFGRPAAWMAVLPLRWLVVLDRPLTRLLRAPYLCVAVCAVRP